MEYNVEKWLSDRGYQTASSDSGITVFDGRGASFTLDGADFSKTENGFMGSGDSIRAALTKSGASAPKGYTPLRNTLSAAGATIGYDKSADAPIVNGQMLNRNDSRLLKIGDDYYIDEKYAKSFYPKEYEDPYGRQTKTLLSELANMEFSYDPESDASLKAAQEEAMLATKQSANSRGLLGGSTAEIMRQRAAQDLVPVYEQKAYERFQDEREAKIERLSLLDSLADNAFREYQGEADLRLSEKKLAGEVQAAADEKAFNQEKLAATNFANQLDKVLAMGEVDAEAASILGIPAGTLTADQKQFITSLNEAARLSVEKMAQEILMSEKEHQQNLERDAKKIQQETASKIRINQSK